MCRWPFWVQLFSQSPIRVLVAISKLQDSNRAECLQLARECLKVAEHKKLILPTDRELYERDTGKSTVQ
ncbi:hypothetical protein D918_06411 [Trichuris suis]|nr:hypothetical protein D918_06411 [Trichuris suis]